MKYDSAHRLLSKIGTVLLSVALSGCADRFVLHPSTQHIDASGARRIEVAAPSGAVEVWTIRSVTSNDREPEAFVLGFVGNESRAETDVKALAAQWSQRIVEIWVVNYPGYGGSSGAARIRSLAPAALAVYDSLKERAGGRPIFISAHSLGTIVALCVAARRPVNGLVLSNAPPLRNLILGRYGWWNLWLGAGPIALQVPDELDSIANGRRIKVPAVFILGDADHFVAPKYQQMVVEAFAGPKRLLHVSNGGHNDPIEGDTLARVKVMLDWLWSQVSTEPPTTRNSDGIELPIAVR